MAGVADPRRAMSVLRRIVLVRHGETEGQSSVRFHGATDVALDAVGQEQIRATARRLGPECFDVVVSSPLRRAWQSAQILAGGVPIALESEFREVDFGRWEGLTAREIEQSDPVLYVDWQAGVESFEYPGGESRADFKGRVERGLDRLLASGAHSALVVAHKGVVRGISLALAGDPLDRERPPLGGVIELTRDGDAWLVGRRSSNPPGLET
jgi:broad specificity phosphatase PhoE